MEDFDRINDLLSVTQHVTGRASIKSVDSIPLFKTSIGEPDTGDKRDEGQRLFPCEKCYQWGMHKKPERMGEAFSSD